MGAASKSLKNQYSYLRVAEIQANVEKHEVEQTANSPKRAKAISGVRKKIAPPPLPEEAVRQRIEPKRFLVLVHYVYPFVVFPEELQDELRELEDFFSILPNQRGEGTIVQHQRLLATISYRLNVKPHNACGFRKTLCELLERYGVEVIDYKISRT